MPTLLEQAITNEIEAASPVAFPTVESWMSPARGIAIGIALGLVAWVALGAVAWLLIA